MVALFSATAGQTQAQSATLDAFTASPTSRDGFATSSAESQGHLRFGAQLYLDYANDPLVYETNSGNADSEIRQIVSHHLVGNLGVSLGLADRIVLFGGLPVSLVMEGDDVSDLPGVPPADGTHLGDAYAGARVRLFGTPRNVFMMAAQVRVTFPLAELVTPGQSYAGDESVTVHPELIAQVNVSRLRLVANLGVRVRENQTFLDTEVGDQVTYGLGALIEVHEGLDLVVEAHGASTVQQFFHREETPLELLGGMKYRHQRGFVAGIGAGPGLVRGFGSPDVRALITVGYTQPERVVTPIRDRDGDGIADDTDVCPDVAEDRDGFEDSDGCPDPDDDGDGLLDAEDACPREAEDMDGFEDQNGCPDVDNDADGVLDVADTCPDTAEDRDGFEDENGCPDADNDGDGVLDVVDACPLVVGVPEQNGCPLPDRDHDGVPDVVDNCPDEPGTVENDGCSVRQLVQIRNTQIQILDNVYFQTNRDVIESRSFTLLDNVARVVAAHPEIVRVRIEGHSDSRGARTHNVRLSESRARSVLRYLVRHGVEEGRLTAVGFGPDRPIVPNASGPDDHSRNRRVEFHIEGSAAMVTTPPPAR